MSSIPPNEAAEWLTNPTLKNEPTISHVRHFITDTLHKRVEDVQELSFKWDLMNVGHDLYVPISRRVSRRAIIKFRDDDDDYTLML